MKTLLCLLFLSFSSGAFAGWDTGNAGDAFSAEFLYTGRDLLQRLEMRAADGKPLLATATLRTVMQKATVASDEHVFLDGIERDAVSYPSKNLIMISRSRWRELREVDETKARLTLVLHEFLWLSGADDQNFQLSTPVIAELNVAPYSPAVWLNSPGTFFATAECTGRLADGSFVTVSVQTKGANKAPDHGEVKFERGGNTYGYRFQAGEISQFYEFDDAATNAAVIGLGAFVNRESPVSVNYSGVNYVDMDLKEVLRSGANKSAATGPAMNFLTVWKGPGFGAQETIQVKGPVCAVWSDN